jgi:hypothetical protein
MTGLDGRGDQILGTLGPRPAWGRALISAEFENFFSPRRGEGVQ